MGLVKTIGSTRHHSNNESFHYVKNTHKTCVSERNEFIQCGDPKYHCGCCLSSVSVLKNRKKTCNKHLMLKAKTSIPLESIYHGLGGLGKLNSGDFNFPYVFPFQPPNFIHLRLPLGRMNGLILVWKFYIRTHQPVDKCQIHPLYVLSPLRNKRAWLMS